MSEISRFGTGERGTFKISKPEEDDRPKVTRFKQFVRAIYWKCWGRFWFNFNYKRPERGKWYWDRHLNELIPFYKRAYMPIHGVVQDTIDPLMSHATAEGKIFDSRSQLFRHYERHGYECTFGELKKGPPKKKKSTPSEIRDQWDRAVADVKYHRINWSEEDRQYHEEEERRMKAWRKRQQTKWAR